MTRICWFFSAATLLRPSRPLVQPESSFKPSKDRDWDDKLFLMISDYQKDIDLDLDDDFECFSFKCWFRNVLVLTLVSDVAHVWQSKESFVPRIASFPTLRRSLERRALPCPSCWLRELWVPCSCGRWGHLQMPCSRRQQEAEEIWKWLPSSVHLLGFVRFRGIGVSRHGCLKIARIAPCKKVEAMTRPWRSSNNNNNNNNHNNNNNNHNNSKHRWTRTKGTRLTRETRQTRRGRCTLDVHGVRTLVSDWHKINFFLVPPATLVRQHNALVATSVARFWNFQRSIT